MRLRIDNSTTMWVVEKKEGFWKGELGFTFKRFCSLVWSWMMNGIPDRRVSLLCAFTPIILTTSGKIVQNKNNKKNLLTVSYMSLSKIPTHEQNALYLPSTPFILQSDTFYPSKTINPYCSRCHGQILEGCFWVGWLVGWFLISYSFKVNKLIFLEHPGFDHSDYHSELKWVTDE